jgi:hypothetical protein
MVSNLSKVIVLPKMSKKDRSAFLCPCPICMEKIEEEQLLYSQVEEVKKMVEELLESTALSTNDFQIDISYPSVGTEQFIKTYVSDSREYSKYFKNSKELLSVANNLRSILQLTFKFNANFRHPLVCALQDRAYITLKETNNMVMPKGDSPYKDLKLGQYQQLLQNISECAHILQKIKADDFLDNEVLLINMVKINKAKKIIALICKKSFIFALQNPDFSPTISVDDYQQVVN